MNEYAQIPGLCFQGGARKADQIHPVAALMQSLDEGEELDLSSPPDTFGIDKKK